MEKYEYAQYTFKALILVQMKTSQLTQSVLNNAESECTYMYTHTFKKKRF